MSLVSTLSKSQLCEVFQIIDSHQTVSPVFGKIWNKNEILKEWEGAQSIGLTDEKTGLQAMIFYRDLGEVLEVSLLATHPSHTQRGVMAQLMTSLIRQNPQAQEIWLEVSASNLSARKFYEKMGFQKVGQRKNYYSNGSDAYLLSFKPRH